ncbi:conjugal transfer protein TrbE [Vibrio harveyi]|uniref:VirB4 family type IV secretion/conjugal transfer ATPase n=1 Tax=Vibrio harveyi TaxID=669 RepID=UPI003BB50AEE
MLNLKTFRDYPSGTPDLLNWAALVDDGVMLGKDGSFTAGWVFTGVDIDSAMASERNFISQRINQALSSLGSGWMVHVDSNREIVRAYSDKQSSHFPHPAFQLIDDSRRVFFESQGDKFASRAVIFVTWRPTSKRLSKLTDLMFENGTSKKTSVAQRNLARFKDKVTDIEGRLSMVFSSIKRLAAYEKDGQWYDDFLSYLRFALTGKWQPIAAPYTPLPLDSFLGACELNVGYNPRLEGQYLSCISIDGFPNHGFPNILHHLNLLNFEYRWNTRFIFFDNVEANNLLDAERKKWEQKVVSFRDKLLKNPEPKVDEDALQMVHQYEEAQTALSSGRLSYGQYSTTFVLRHADKDILQEQTEQLTKILNSMLGFTSRVETINSIEAFLGTLPSDSLHNIRRPLLSTMNLSHLLPTSSIWTGEEYCPCPFYPEQSPPLMYCTAAGNTPYRLNFHVDDVGHTLAFGPTGAGKSTLIAVMVAQFFRYKGAKVFAFDKGYSLFTLSQLGGQHFDIGAQASANDPSFAPLSDLDNDFEWCCDYIEKLLVLQGVKVNAEHRVSIFKALSDMRSSSRKSLSEFCTQVQDPEIKTAMSYYTVKGRGGDLLDAEQNRMNLTNFMVFEIEHLMGRGEIDLIPVLVYLFRQIERAIKGATNNDPSLIVIDEAWIALSHPVFREMLKEWLKVLRKANCMVFLATQSLGDAIKSGILDVLIESCPTHIFLPNPKATQFADTYRQFGLNDKQIDLIKRAVQKREYYVSQPVGSRMINLSLDKLALSFVGVSDKGSITEVKALVNEQGENWYLHWMKRKNLYGDVT